MRFAVYFAPEPSHLLHQLGTRWLGRDAFTGATCIQPVADLSEITAEPRRYGFHATLKPPFALKNEASLAALELAVEALARSVSPFEITLVLKQIDGFLALMPMAKPLELDHLAAACVRSLDDYRRPASKAEIERRRSAGLTPVQQDYLERWGYPYVLDEFRFHMTLSRRLSPTETQAVMPLAQAHFAGVLGCPLAIDALTLFVEPGPSADFAVHRRFPFQHSTAEAAS